MTKAQWSWVSIDIGNSAFATTILAALFPVYLPSLMPAEGLEVSLFGYHWHTTAISIWGYSVSLSLLIALFLTPLLGAWADRGKHRKLLLGISALLGATATAGLFFCDRWETAMMTFVIANIGFAANNIFYNSLLPDVGEESEWHSLSLKGFAWGYVGGGVLLAINLLMVMKYEWFGWASKKEGVQWSFLSVSIWWLLFTIPPLLFIKEKLALKANEIAKASEHPLRSIWNTFLSVLKNKNLLIFMLSFALYNDGIQTVISMASIFGKQILSLPEDTLIGTLLMIQFLGLPFTLLMTKAGDKFGIKKTLTASIVFWVAIVAYAYYMKSAGDFWILGVMVAIVLGVSQALPRSIYALLIPKGRQAEYFSFFALSGKMTSIMGPTLFGVVRDMTGEVRLSILALGILFVLGLAGLAFVKIPRAQ